MRTARTVTVTSEKFCLPHKMIIFDKYYYFWFFVQLLILLQSYQYSSLGLVTKGEIWDLLEQNF